MGPLGDGGFRRDGAGGRRDVVGAAGAGDVETTRVLMIRSEPGMGWPTILPSQGDPAIVAGAIIVAATSRTRAVWGNMGLGGEQWGRPGGGAPGTVPSPIARICHQRPRQNLADTSATAWWSNSKRPQGYASPYTLPRVLEWETGSGKLRLHPPASPRVGGSALRRGGPSG